MAGEISYRYYAVWGNDAWAAYRALTRRCPSFTKTVGPTHRAVVAYDGAVPVGMLAFACTSTQRPYAIGGVLCASGTLIANGTFVRPAYRSKKIAINLWTLALNTTGQTVHVTVTKKGGPVVLGAAARFPRVTFQIEAYRHELRADLPNVQITVSDEQTPIYPLYLA